MTFFLIMIAPPLIVCFAVASLFWWGARGKETYSRK
ncbi:cytochrome bd oxidase small subunit CydS [Bacillus solitudinis]